MPKSAQLISWLSDAYAMETGLIPILENHARDAKDDPDARSRIQLHAQQTRRHAELVKECIEGLGGRLSPVRAGLSSLIGSIESFATAPFSDELVKNTLMDYASEHFEIACYTALASAAASAGADDVVVVCETILAEEREMARWLEGQIPVVVQNALHAHR